MKINIEMNERDKEIGVKILIGIIALIAMIALVVSMIFISNKSKNKKNDTATSKTTNETSSTSGTKASETSKNATTAAVKKVNVTYTMTKGSNWEGNGKKYQQYTLTIQNNESATLKDWIYTITLQEGGEITQSWNCNLENNNGVYTVKPVDYNKEIQAGKSVTDIGFTMCYSTYDSIKSSSLKIDMSNGTNVTVDNDGNVSDGNIVASETTATTAATAATESATEAPASNPGGGTSSSTAITNPSGPLRVSGTNLVDGSGNIVQLKGVSTHGIQWGEMKPYVNQQAIQTLHDDWGANVFRIAMYVEEGGYMSGNQDELKQIIDNGVRYATELGMYAIIDWHVLNFSPDRYTEQAKAFFAEMAQKYANNDYVIYEICNEPVGSNWNNNIKPYAEAVIASIRQYDSDAIVLVGTNTWSQDVTDVIGNRIDDANTMYVLHYYAATHKDDLRGKLKTALNAGIPIFVSESSICDASGNGGIDEASANAWLSLLNENNISFVAWSLCNKNETSALISNGCSKLYGWTDDELSTTGRWYKKAISGK